MPEMHEMSFDGFDFRVHVTDEGGVEVSFHESGKCVWSCDWDTFRECIDFAGIHGLKMKQPTLAEYDNLNDLDAARRGVTNCER